MTATPVCPLRHALSLSLSLSLRLSLSASLSLSLRLSLYVSLSTAHIQTESPHTPLSPLALFLHTRRPRARTHRSAVVPRTRPPPPHGAPGKDPPPLPVTGGWLGLGKKRESERCLYIAGEGPPLRSQSPPPYTKPPAPLSAQPSLPRPFPQTKSRPSAPYLSSFRAGSLAERGGALRESSLARRLALDEQARSRHAQHIRVVCARRTCS